MTFAIALSLLSPLTYANTWANQTIEQIYYCAEDFALKMSGGDWYLVQKSVVGEKKFDHFLSLSMYMMSTGKKTANIFPKEPIETWCGNSGFKPITILSIQN
ncbi:hypothetical protein [Photobacterium sp. R1]